MKCEKCGSEMKLQEGIVYASNPVRYGYKCPKCGNMQYSMIKEENNQMDYEKKYKEALSNARQEYDTTENVERKQWLEELFPELAESEDEKIKKAILEGLIDCRDAPDLGWTNFGGIKIDDCIAWLEKQGDKDIRYNYLEEIIAADDIYQMSMNDAMTNEVKEKAVKALSKLGIGKLLGFEKKADKYEGYCEGCNNVKGCVTCVDGDQWAHYKEVEQKPVDKVEQIVSKDFYSVFSKEQVEEIDKRIEESQRLYNAKLMDAIRKAKDFPMTD